MIFTYIFNVHNFWRQERRRIRLSFHLLQTLQIRVCQLHIWRAAAILISLGFMVYFDCWLFEYLYPTLVAAAAVANFPKYGLTKYRCCGRAPSEILPYFLRQWTYHPMEFGFSLYWSCKVEINVFIFNLGYPSF